LYCQFSLALYGPYLINSTDLRINFRSSSSGGFLGPGHTEKRKDTLSP
jgi:hypothetical protein